MAIRRGERSRKRKRSEMAHRGRKSAPPSGRRLWLRRALQWGGGLALLGLIALASAVFFAARNMPSYSGLMSSQHGQMIVVRARDGTEIVALGPSYGNWLTWNEIPQPMKDAMISVEDRRFYSHPGVDPIGLARAVWVWISGDERIGATSTITQQLARNVFLNTNRTFDRKLREAVLAMALEYKFSKEQILELYLNKV
jgi:penicillin-binding protein 1A